MLFHQIILYVLEKVFRNNIKITITINGKIIDEKFQNDINKEAAKTSALLSGKIDKYEYLTGEEILQSDQFRRITSYVYLFSFRKNFRKTNKKRLKATEKNKKETIRNRLEKQMFDTN